ncbi:MAG TPA: T9SS type A sorting domain-containing protein [Bacteroidia bacterium]|nr:T9SS type A sorting domain-containing protein [Bacteroidia bacterium]HNU32439.1 T9SS type A sorting domain-containing protein [Bacteroidia bacterium]
MATNGVNSKNNNFKNVNMMETKILKLTNAQFNSFALKSATIVFISIMLLLLSILKTNAANYYWVGGSGNWSDVSHWATTSGGGTFHAVPPTANDDVHFDASSFVSNTDSVIVDAALTNIYCKNFQWTTLSFSPTFYGQWSSNLNVFGSISLDQPLKFEFKGKIILLGNSFNQIFTDGVALSGPGGYTDQLTINGTGTWNLTSELAVVGILFNNGTFNTLNNNIIAYGFITMASASNVNLGSSIISVGANFTVGGGILNADSATIVLDKNLITGWSYSQYMFFGNTSKVICNDDCMVNTNADKLIAYNDVIALTGNYDTVFFNNPGSTVAVDNLTVDSVFIITSNSAFPVTLKSTQAGIQSSLFKSSGAVCIQNVFIQDLSVSGGAQFFAGNGCVDLGNNTGWQFAPCSVVSDVWPGDVNYDLTVNNNDVLNIGLAYNNTGPVRTGASLAYVAQPATDWNGYFANAVNHKHADTNGDGVVDNNDTAAITLNYGLMHPARLAGNTSQTFTGPQLYLQASADTVTEGDTVEFEIYLGDAANPISNIYGLAFTINIDTTFVDTVYSNFDFTGCWMGTEGVDLLTYNQPLWSQSKIDVALTRTTQTDTSGYGYLGRVGVVVVDNIGARITSPGYMTMPVSISNVYAINFAENILSITTLGDSVVVDTTGTVGINNLINLNSAVLVYPNPSKDKINIKSNKLVIENAELINAMGKVLTQTKAEANAVEVNLQNITSGIYVLRIKTDKGVVNKKIQVI